MSRKLMNLALMYTAITAYASEYPFGSPSPRLDTPKGNIPSDKLNMAHFLYSLRMVVIFALH